VCAARRVTCAAGNREGVRVRRLTLGRDVLNRLLPQRKHDWVSGARLVCDPFDLKMHLGVPRGEIRTL